MGFFENFFLLKQEYDVHILTMHQMGVEWVSYNQLHRFLFRFK